MTLDPNCFTDEVLTLIAPGFSNIIEARVFAYSTPWMTYQVTFNSHDLVARCGIGEWECKFGRHHAAIIDHFNLYERFGIETKERISRYGY